MRFYWLVLSLLIFSCLWLIVSSILDYQKSRHELKRRLGSIIKPNHVSHDNLTTDHDFSERLLQSLGELYVYQQLDLLLIRAGLSVTIPSLIKITISILLIEIVSAWLLGAKSYISALSITTIVLIYLYLKILSIKRRNQIEQQLPDVVEFISNSLKVGNSIEVTFQMVGHEFQHICADQFKKVHEEIEFGTQLKEALNNLSKRVDSKHIRYMVVAILIQHDSGGNLLETMEQITLSLRARVMMDRKIKTLTAEGRTSAIIISCMPVFMAILLTWLNPQYMSALWHTQEGIVMLESGIIMMAFGGVWLWKLVQIKM